MRELIGAARQPLPQTPLTRWVVSVFLFWCRFGRSVAWWDKLGHAIVARVRTRTAERFPTQVHIRRFP